MIHNGFPGWQNVPVRAIAVAPGDVVSVKVEGGWFRKPSPTVGVIYTMLNGEEVFLPAGFPLERKADRRR